MSCAILVCSWILSGLPFLVCLGHNGSPQTALLAARIHQNWLNSTQQWPHTSEPSESVRIQYYYTLSCKSNTFTQFGPQTALLAARIHQNWLNSTQQWPHTSEPSESVGFSTTTHYLANPTLSRSLGHKQALLAARIHQNWLNSTQQWPHTSEPSESFGPQTALLAARIHQNWLNSTQQWPHTSEPSESVGFSTTTHYHCKSNTFTQFGPQTGSAGCKNSPELAKQHSAVATHIRTI
ncbi:hypothetical protein BDR26DRAFT_946833 [Obelidium mucronatum]|nr:hypothetical protein BDR26DRAFT_946833 [Obelidium mucronatum]